MVLRFHLRGREPSMLDAYIIDKIREQREDRREGGFIPARIDAPAPPPRHPDQDRDDDEPRERGTVIIDFHF